MPILGIHKIWSNIGLAAVMSIVFATHSLAQSFSQIAPPPVPLGYSSPPVVVAPSATAFGPPPMAIGPAPYPSNYAYRVPYAQPYGARPYIAAQPYSAVPLAYSSPTYPNNPAWARRSTPFDAGPNPYANSAPRLAPQSINQPFDSGIPVDSGTVWNQPVERQTLSVPASIGNLRIVVSDRFLNRLVARNEQKPGDVRDVILGAEVTGHQTTETNLHLDLLPSPDKIRGTFILNGATESQTTGVTPQAMVDVASQQRFVATKDVYFDGISFSTRHASVHVQARNQTLGATTPLSGTLFGRLADRIAYRTAERRQPQAEAETRDHVADRVGPEFDGEVDQKLALANDNLEGVVRRRLREMNMMPTQYQASSTDTAISYSAQFGTETPTVSSPAFENQATRDEGVRLLVHESFLNALLSHTGVKGLKTTDKEIDKFFAPFVVPPTEDDLKNTPPPIAMPGMENVVTNIEFDDIQPLTLRLDKDRVYVTMHAVFKPAGQDLLPPLAVTIEYKATLSGSKILVTPGQVQVALQKNDTADTATGLALKLITQAVESNLSKLAFDRSVPASLWSYSGIVPSVTGLRSQDGWTAISID